MSVFPSRAFYYYYSPEGDEMSAPREPVSEDTHSP